MNFDFSDRNEQNYEIDGPESPVICIDMIAQIAQHLKSIEDIKNFKLLNKSVYEVLSMERNVMKKICYHFVLPKIKDDLISCIEQKGKSIRNLNIELEEAFLKFLIFVFSKGLNLEEFTFKCTRLHELDLNENADKSDDILAMDAINVDSKDIANMKYLRQLTLDLSSFVSLKNNFLELMIQVLNKAKNLEEFSFTCEDLRMNHQLSEFGTTFDDSQILANSSTSLNSYDLNPMISLKKLLIHISSSNDHTEDELPKFLCSILNKPKNLEELHIKCSQLQSSTINLENCNNINNLKIMSLNCTSIDNADHIQNFIYRQTNLKNLSLNIELTSSPIVFSGNNAHLRLEKLALNVVDENDFFVPRFIETQRDLKELELSNVSNPETYLLMFEHCRNLEILKIDGEGSSIIFSPAFPERSLESLYHFEEKNSHNCTDARGMYNRFPYIRTLTCMGLRNANIGFYHLNELRLDSVWCYDLSKFMAPNLQLLVIKKLARYDECLGEFLQCIKNVEIVTIESLSNKNDVKDVIGEFLKLENLKRFNLRHSVGSIPQPRNIDENENVGENTILFKILIDTEKKTVKVSSYVYQKCDEIMSLLRNKFDNFDFIEFCF